ncbi:MAG: hypothetical protein HY795_04925 [Desulfovibrio sp.]|nr:hypothetical protein [Desulfovibrio sp.]MBI4960513.1 hypothetical protein [Desulfovibrio sp.]
MKWLAASSFLLLVLVWSHDIHAQGQPADSFEIPYNLSASRILPKALLSGPHHRVEEVVENDGYMNIYTVRSRYGSYRIVSTALLATRVDEFAAMHAMDKANGAKEYGKGVWEGGVSMVEGVKNLVTAPVDTLEGAASGVGKLFSRAGESISGSKASKYEDSTGAKLTGFASTRREYAVAFGVDPYSTNERLQEKLRAVAAPGYAGGLTTMGLKALIPGGVGIAVSSVSGVNWLGQIDLAQPPQDLRIHNRKTLEAMGIPEESSRFFMDNDEFTPTQQSLLVKALSDLGRAGGRDTFVRLAARTENQDQAFFRQRMALMYAGFHRKVNAIRGFVKLGTLVGALTNEGKLVLCFPLDNLCWTKALGKLSGGIEVAVDKFKPAAVELWVTGTVSARAKQALSERKWVVREGAGQELLGEKM